VIYFHYWYYKIAKTFDIAKNIFLITEQAIIAEALITSEVYWFHSYLAVFNFK